MVNLVLINGNLWSEEMDNTVPHPLKKVKSYIELAKIESEKLVQDSSGKPVKRETCSAHRIQ